ncbi:MAG: hypothetical protein QXR53_01190 [Candidatus Norongarragalinales archaeon]
MPADSKQGKPPVVKPAPPVQEVHKEIVIPLRFKVGKEFTSKLPFLVALFLFFSFSMVMFDKSNFKTTDLSDLQRVYFNIPKLYSLSFILFMVLFSLAMALGIYYSIGLGWIPSLLVVPATFLPAVVAGMLFFPALTGAFMVFALTISFTSLVASFWPGYSLSRAWSILSLSMVLFALLAFFVVFYKVAENKDVHVDLFLNSLVAQSQGGGLGSISIPAQVISSSLTKDDFASFITQNDIRDLLLSSYPNFASLSDQEKEAAITAFHTKMVDLGFKSFQENSGLISDALGRSLSSRFASGSEALKQQIYLLPQFKLIYDRYAFFSGALAALVASFIAIFIQILAVAFLFALHKLVPQP